MVIRRVVQSLCNGAMSQLSLPLGTTVRKIAQSDKAMNRFEGLARRAAASSGPIQSTPTKYKTPKWIK